MVLLNCLEVNVFGVEVLGISTDSHFSHLAWIERPRKQGGLGDMDIPLLADKNMSISKAYGVLKVQLFVREIQILPPFFEENMIPKRLNWSLI